MSAHKRFICLLVGQAVSGLGSSLTSFALSLWVYQESQNPSHLALLYFSLMAPRIYFSLFAGHWVDRLNRKTLIQVCDVGLVLTALLLLAVVGRSTFSIYFLMGVYFIQGVFACFQSLAFQASVTLFIKKNQLLKYNGLMSVLRNTPLLFGPVLGGALIVLVSMESIIFLDILTFLIGFTVTALISFPKVRHHNLPSRFEWKQTAFGVRYIFRHKTLKKILLVFSFENFFSGLTLGLLTAFLLAKTNGDNLLTAYSFSFVSLGGVLGGLLTMKIARWVKKPFALVLVGFFVSALIGRVFAGAISVVMGIGVFLVIRNMIIPVVNAACETIWQTHTPQEYQGRVFGARRFFAQGPLPLALLMGALLLDGLFPVEGVWVKSFSGGFLGSRPEVLQLSLFFILCGVLEMTVPLYYYLKSKSGICS